MSNLKNIIKEAIIEQLSEATAETKVLTRSLSFNDSGTYNLAKSLHWPSEIEIKFDDKTKSATFKTQKMKTVAKC